MPITSNILRKYLNPTYVESGLYLCDSLWAAKEVGFPELYSIEVNQGYYDNGVRAFKDHPNVHLIRGDSGEVLWDVIKNIHTKITYFLDGHGEGSPLLKELTQIAHHPIRDSTLILDDRRLWEKEYNFSENQVKDLCLKINPKYQFTLENGHIEGDVMIVQVKE